MKAAVFDAYRAPLRVSELPDPVCPADGVIVSVRACGVCRSDHHAWTGLDPDVALPHVPGHEFAGVIEEVGPDIRRWRKGDRVTAPFILACGECQECRGGDPTTCDRQHVAGFSSWGAFAQRIALPHADFNLVRMPDVMDFAVAAGMGCRVTTAFRALFDRAKLQPGEWFAVHGCGGVGLAAVMLAAAAGARIVAVDINDEALAMARSLGANTVINVTATPDVGSAIRDLTGGGVHVSIDALGIAATFVNSLASLRKLGRHVQIGMPVGAHASPRIPLLDIVYSRQVTLMGTRGIPAARFPALLAMVGSGRIDPARLITRRVALEEAGAALEAMNRFHGSGVTVIDRF